MQEPVLWINWEKDTSNIEEPAASQKKEKCMKDLNARQITGAEAFC